LAQVFAASVFEEIGKLSIIVFKGFAIACKNQMFGIVYWLNVNKTFLRLTIA
jgi:hypothetical protein